MLETARMPEEAAHKTDDLYYLETEERMIIRIEIRRMVIFKTTKILPVPE